MDCGFTMILLPAPRINSKVNNVLYKPARAYKEHYFPLHKNDKENNVIISSVKKIKKLLPALNQQGTHKFFISPSEAREI